MSFAIILHDERVIDGDIIGALFEFQQGIAFGGHHFTDQ